MTRAPLHAEAVAGAAVAGAVVDAQAAAVHVPQVVGVLHDLQEAALRSLPGHQVAVGAAHRVPRVAVAPSLPGRLVAVGAAPRVRPVVAVASPAPQRVAALRVPRAVRVHRSPPVAACLPPPHSVPQGATDRPPVAAGPRVVTGVPRNCLPEAGQVLEVAIVLRNCLPGIDKAAGMLPIALRNFRPTNQGREQGQAIGPAPGKGPTALRNFLPTDQAQEQAIAPEVETLPIVPRSFPPIPETGQARAIALTPCLPSAPAKVISGISLASPRAESPVASSAVRWEIVPHNFLQNGPA